MNKSQLVDAIAKEAAITKVDAKKALDAFIAVTGNTLKAGDKIALVGFGSFSVAKNLVVPDVTLVPVLLSKIARRRSLNLKLVQN